ncbi:hypothetical protein PV079_27830 [Klebsiella pneumoniae]|uniref:hypothetical protein n=1 Tax=Klebsiella pneumoniae TaxID=573 RepID=UPI0030A0ABB8
MKKFKFSLILCLCTLSISVYSASLVESYIDGAKKVCVYDDGSKVYVGVADQCPIMKL